MLRLLFVLVFFGLPRIINRNFFEQVLIQIKNKCLKKGRKQNPNSAFSVNICWKKNFCLEVLESGTSTFQSRNFAFQLLRQLQRAGTCGAEKWGYLFWQLFSSHGNQAPKLHFHLFGLHQCSQGAKLPTTRAAALHFPSASEAERWIWESNINFSVFSTFAKTCRAAARNLFLLQSSIYEVPLMKKKTRFKPTVAL